MKLVYLLRCKIKKRKGGVTYDEMISIVLVPAKLWYIYNVFSSCFQSTMKSALKKSRNGKNLRVRFLLNPLDRSLNKGYADAGVGVS